MKKELILLTLILLLTTKIWAQFAGGDGSEADPYQITTAQQLDAVRTYAGVSGVHFRIMNNIDLEEYTGIKYPTVGWLPINNFKGYMHGGGNRISGLWINRPTTAYVGLFRYLNGATVDSLGVRTTGVGITGQNYVGALTGYSMFNSYIYYSYAICEVTSTGYSVGGLVGWNDQSKIEKCYTHGNVQGTNVSSGNNYVGGLVGNVTSGSVVNNCYSSCNVTGRITVGGLIGETFDAPTNYVMSSYSTGKVIALSDSRYVGGFIGFVGYSEITDCYYDIESCGLTDASGSGLNSGITSKTTAEMMQQATFANWNFSDVWRITENVIYPVFDCMMPIQGEKMLCNGVQELYSNDDLLRDFNWSISGGGSILNGQTDYKTLVEWNQVGKYIITLSYHGASMCMATNSPLSAAITVNQIPTSIISGIGEICKGDNANLSITSTGTSPWSVAYSDGTNIVTVDNINTSVYSINDNPLKNTTYSMINVADKYCSSEPTSTFNVNIKKPSTTSLVNNDYCWFGVFDNTWDDVSNWQVFDGTKLIDASQVPNQVNNVFLRSIETCPFQTLTVPEDVEVSCKNLNISTKLIMLANSKLNIKGNFICEGIFESRNSTVNFVGSSNQIIDARGSNFYNVSFNNLYIGNDDFTITSPINIQGNAEFSNGIVVFEDTGNITFMNGATSNGGSSQSFVKGSVTKIGSNDFLFPVGDIKMRNIGDGNKLYKVLGTFKISPSTNANVSVEYLYSNVGMPDWWNNGTNMGANLHHVSDREHWIISSSVDLNTLGMYWLDNQQNSGEASIHGFDDNGSVFNPNDLTVAYWNGSKWINAGVSGNSTIAYESGYIESASIIPFGAKASTIVTFGSIYGDNPLPVDLLYFSAICNKGVVEIQWETASEINNDYFILEKSEDLRSFREIAKINGAGSSNTIISYKINDKQLKTNLSYYRLRQVDYDGTEKLYNITSANCDKEDSMEIEVFPNPVHNDLNLVIKNCDSEELIVEVINNIGQIVIYKNLSIIDSIYQEAISVDELNDGIYYLRILSGGNLYTKTFVKE